MPNYRVSLAFVNLPDASLSVFAGQVATGLAEHVLMFPSPPVPVADLRAAMDAFDVARSAAAGGGKILTILKNQKRVELEQLLRQEATYVQRIASQDLAMLLASGFNATNTNRVQSPLDTPRIKKLEYGHSTELLLTIIRVPNAKSYEVQMKNGDGDWAPVGVFGTARNIRLRGYTPGQTYSLRARGVGGSTGYSPWSDPVTRMAL